MHCNGAQCHVIGSQHVRNASSSSRKSKQTGAMLSATALRGFLSQGEDEASCNFLWGLPGQARKHTRKNLKATPAGFEPARGDPIGLAGRRLNHSAKVSDAWCEFLILRIVKLSHVAKYGQPAVLHSPCNYIPCSLAVGTQSCLKATIPNSGMAQKPRIQHVDRNRPRNERWGSCAIAYTGSEDRTHDLSRVRRMS